MFQLQLFKYEEQNAFRNLTVLDVDGEPWFIAKEISEILGYSDAFEMVKRLDDDQKINRLVAGFGNRGVITVNESGLYVSIIGSSKPPALDSLFWRAGHPNPQ